jgi:putative ABC transport system substrate-binding protein
MRRREFLEALGGAAVAWPLAARAQQGERVRRISLLISGAESDPEMQARVTAVRQGLTRVGWSEGYNIQIDYRYASASAQRAQAFARELVALKPEVIIAFGTFTARALHRETTTVPIVFVGVADPIGDQFVTSLARPGANLTGTLLNEPGIVGKWLAMLKEIAPRLECVAVLFNPKTSPYRRVYAENAEDIARALAIKIVPLEISAADDILRGISNFANSPNGGLMVPPDLTAVTNRDLVIGLAFQHRLPAVYQARFWAIAGGLMSYGTDRIAAHRQIAYYVDHILRGAKPSDLPVQTPTKYETTINLKTARAIGLAMPPGLLVAADEVIE